MPRKNPALARSIKQRLGPEAYEHYKATGEYDVAAFEQHREHSQTEYTRSEPRDLSALPPTWDFYDKLRALRPEFVSSKIWWQTAYHLWEAGRVQPVAEATMLDTAEQSPDLVEFCRRLAAFAQIFKSSKLHIVAAIKIMRG